MRLGHHDGARPFAARELWDPEGLDFRIGMGEENPGRRASGHGQHREGERCPVERFGEGGLNDLRHRVSAISLRQNQARPAAGAEGVVCVGETRRQPDRAILERRSDSVGDSVHRRDDFRGDPCRLVDDGLQALHVDMREIGPGKNPFRIDHVPQKEQDVVYRRPVGHVPLSAPVSSGSRASVSGSTATP